MLLSLKIEVYILSFLSIGTAQKAAKTNMNMTYPYIGLLL
jgi:hypothetical protein